MDFHCACYDRYNRNGGKQVTIGPVTITGQFMGEFHRQGIARASSTAQAESVADSHGNMASRFRPHNTCPRVNADMYVGLVGPRAARIGIVFALALLGCGSAAEDAGGGATAPIEEIERTLGFSLPAGAEVLSQRIEAGMDDAHFIKLAFPATAWDLFLDAAGMEEADFAGDRRFLLSFDSDDWDRSAPVTLPTVQAQGPGGRVFDIGADRARAGLVVLYVMEHGT